jgi:hypothetical protein
VIALSLTSANGLQLVEWDRLARSCPLEPKLSAFVSTRDTVKHGDDAARVWVGVLDRHRKQGAGKGALLDMSALRQPRKSSRVLLVKGDVQAMRRSLHGWNITTRTGTYRAHRDGVAEKSPAGLQTAT